MSMTNEELEQLKQVLSNPLLFPLPFKEWLQDWYATNIPKIGVSQVFGFKIHSIKEGPPVAASESTSSTSYTDLTTIGPTLDKLANGYYLVFFGAYVNIYVAGGLRYMAVSVDGSTPVDDDAARMDAGSGGRAVLVDITQGNNDHTLKAKYKVASGTQSFADRWLYALKVTFDE